MLLILPVPSSDNRFRLTFNDGNAERVDALSYGWKKLRTNSLEVQEKLLELQPVFKKELNDGIEKFKVQSSEFMSDYNTKGPMESGVSPREASDRLAIFQTQFNEIWRKHELYAGGQELFGLTVKPDQELNETKKELGLLQKLYGLYDDVNNTIDGYAEVPWAEVNINEINDKLGDFMSRCRKLPKGLRDWQAYKDLQKKIDDFNETIPLLEMMSNKAMQKRHWERISEQTKHTFDFDNETLLLKHIVEAPLLENKEDIEDICISAVKEKDIEAKLNIVINDWNGREFLFSPFKSRGELLLKGIFSY